MKREKMILPSWSLRGSLILIVFSLSSLWLDAGSGLGESPIRESLKPGLTQITQDRVTGTISFLASDELAGRATGSPEFNIAASYVAARFRGAHLEGGAADGSFYHETIMKMIQVPGTPIQLLSGDSKLLPNYGLLAADTKAFQYTGSVKNVDLENIPESGLSGVVAGPFISDAKGPRRLSQIARLTTALQSAGASCLLLGIPEGSELIAAASEERSKAKPESRQTRFAIPVLLVPMETLSATNVQLEIPAMIATEAPMRNVIGVLKGSDPELSKEAILFSAHLDHLGARPGIGDGIFNGADDDATGVTAVLTLADAFAAMPQPKRSILFMTFWGEESGLLGSKQFVQTPSWPLEKIIANINIEMIGRPEPGANNKIWMTGWGESDLGKIMAEGAKGASIEIFEHPKFSAMLYRQSDNWSFVEKGVIAHSFSAGSLHADYHQPDDEWERLEIPHMTRVIQGLFAGSEAIANGEVSPKKKPD